jgi:uncharacterized protein YndB with AHSA1/START domain
VAPDAVERAIVVRCPVERAFALFTAHVDSWWPKSHSRSGDPATHVYIEPRAGGRIYERATAGAEHTWGEVVIWDPPRHLAYHWYLGSSAERPSRVDARFTDLGDGRTHVAVTHRGPELVGELWARNSPIYTASWDQLLPAFAARCQAGEPGDASPAARPR